MEPLNCLVLATREITARTCVRPFSKRQSRIWYGVVRVLKRGESKIQNLEKVEMMMLVSFVNPGELFSFEASSTFYGEVFYRAKLKLEVHS
jgi:hypothetical protein